MGKTNKCREEREIGSMNIKKPLLSALMLFFFMLNLVGTTVFGVTADYTSPDTPVVLTESDFILESSEIKGFSEEGLSKLVQSGNILISLENAVKIADHAFENIPLKKITISSVQPLIVGKYAFYNTGLESVFLTGVTILEDYSLSSNKIKDFSADDKLNTLGVGSLENNSLESVTLGATLLQSLSLNNNPLKTLNLTAQQVVIEPSVFAINSGVTVNTQDNSLLSNDINTYMVNPVDVVISFHDTIGNTIKPAEIIKKEKAELPFEYTVPEINGYVKSYDKVAVDESGFLLMYEVAEPETTTSSESEDFYENTFTSDSVIGQEITSASTEIHQQTISETSSVSMEDSKTIDTENTVAPIFESTVSSQEITSTRADDTQIVNNIPRFSMRSLLITPMAVNPSNITFNALKKSNLSEYVNGRDTFMGGARFIISGTEKEKADYKIVFTMPQYASNPNAPTSTPGVDVVISQTAPYTITYTMRNVSGGFDVELMASAQYSNKTPKGYPGEIKTELYNITGGANTLIKSATSGPYPSTYSFNPTTKKVREPLISGSKDPTGSYILDGTENDYVYTITPQSGIPPREVKEYIIEDILPTYSKYNTATKTYTTARAKFDPAKNPGWSLSSDGTKAIKTILPGGLNIVGENITLSFPLAKVASTITNTAQVTYVINNPTYNDKNETSSASVSIGISGDPMGQLYRKVPGNWTYSSDYQGEILTSNIFSLKETASVYIDKTNLYGKPIIPWHLSANILASGNEIPDSLKFVDDGLDSKLQFAFISFFNSTTTRYVTPEQEALKLKYSYDVQGRTVSGTLSYAESFTIPVGERPLVKNIKAEIIGLTEAHVGNNYGFMVGTEYRDLNSIPKIPTEQNGTIYHTGTNTATFTYSVKNKTTGNVTSYPATFTSNYFLTDKSVELGTSVSSSRTDVIQGNRLSLHMSSSAKSISSSGQPEDPNVLIGKNLHAVYILPEAIELYNPTITFGSFKNLYDLKITRMADGNTRMDITSKDPERMLSAKDIQAVDINYISGISIKSTAPSGTYTVESYLAVDTGSKKTTYRTSGKINPYNNRMGAYDSITFSAMKNKLFYLYKEIAKLNEPFSQYIRTNPNEEFEYKITMDNSTDNQINAMNLLDIFPYPGDYELVENGSGVRAKRDSIFSNTFVSVVSVKLRDSAGTKDITSTTPIKYITDITGVPKDGTTKISSWLSANISKFSNTPSSSVKGILLGDSNTKIPPQTQMILTLKMKTPSNPDISLNKKSATNSSAYRHSSTPEFVEGNTVFNVLDVPERNITIKKTDKDTGAPLQGAQFSLEMSGISPMTGTTDATGTLVFNSLPYGSYTLKETKAPDGYVNTGLPSFTENDAVNNVHNITNVKVKGSITVTKKDSKSGSVLQGAVISLLQNGTEIKTATSGADGKAVFTNLELGDYSIKEKTAPANYQLSSEEKKVSLTASNLSVQIDYMNTLLTGTVTVTKKDADSGALLQGAVMSIIQNGTEIATATTGINGKATFTGIPYGSYTVKEKTAPSGYKLSTEEKPVTVNSSSPSVQLDYMNTLLTGTVTVIKKDASTGALLQGAVMSLIQNGTEIKTATTDSSGKAIFTAVPYGSYTVKEKTAPSGYKLSTEDKPVTVNSSSPSVQLDYMNTLLTGTVTVIKKDAGSGALIQGAVMSLIQNGTEIKTATTDASGKAIFTAVPYGSYTVKEKTAPSGYKLSTEEKPVTVNNASPNVSIDYLNTRSIITIIVTDKSSDTKVPLKGSDFSLIQNGKEVSKGTTDSNGNIVFKDVPYGDYIIRQTKVVDGYIINTKDSVVNVADFEKASGFDGVINVEVLNDPIKGSITILKKDSISGGNMAAVKFNILDKDKKIVKTGVTDVNGVLKFDNLSIGHYFINEVETKEGYGLPTVMEAFDITASVPDVTKTIQNTVRTFPIVGSSLTILTIIGLTGGVIMSFVLRKKKNKTE